MHKLFPYSWKISFWFWWLVLTVIYVGFSFLGGLYAAGSIFGYITGAVGIFVPMGIWNFVASLPSNWGESTGVEFLAFPILIIWIIFFDKIVYSLKIAGSWKIVVNLIGLMLITLITDLVLWGAWPTISIFIGGGIDLG